MRACVYRGYDDALANVESIVEFSPSISVHIYLAHHYRIFF